MQYVEVMTLYLWLFKYFKFPVSHSTIQLECGDVPSMLTNGLVTAITQCCTTDAKVV